jgi:hypothetical protein
VDEDAAPAVLPRLRLQVRQAKTARSRSLRITLLGFEASTFAEVLSSRQSRTPTRAVDAWGVDTAWRPGQPFSPAWFAAKERRQPAARRTSPSLRIEPGGEILVQAWDAFGVSATALIELH